MNHWAAYIKEREGHEVIEDDYGFIEYKLAPPFAAIEGCYIMPERRKSGLGRELMERVVRLAREEHCTLLVCEVNLEYLNATDSLKACLGVGFKLQSAQNNRIIMMKDIVGA